MRRGSRKPVGGGGAGVWGEGTGGVFRAEVVDGVLEGRVVGGLRLLGPGGHLGAAPGAAGAGGGMV